MITKKQSVYSLYLLPFLAKPANAFLFSFTVYFIIVTFGGGPFRTTPTAYFNYLADAFLHGQLNLRIIPPNTQDLSIFNGNFYLYWPPMPAIILMPFIVLFGIHFSDIFFNIVIAALNVGIVAMLFQEVDRQKLVNLDRSLRGLLVAFFAFGTVHVVMAVPGRIWFTAQLLGFCFVGLAYLSALKLEGSRAFLLTGLLMACAMLTRNHLIFTGIWPAYHLIAKHWQKRHNLILYSLTGLLPLMVFGLLFLLYNYSRYGNPFELGLRYHQMALYFAGDYKQYGAFNLHYVPINFYYQYIFYPLPFTEKSFNGGSLFLLSPLFFYVFRSFAKKIRNINTLLWGASIALTSIPILLLMGTGWVQYGPRYTLDFTVPLLLLTSAGLGSSYSKLTAWLVILSIIQYIPGVLLFSF